MPLKCYNKPNRSQPRHWGPPGLTRVFTKVCELHGKEQAWAAVQRAKCGRPTELEKLLRDVEDVINGILAGYGALQGIISVSKKLFASAAWRYFLRFLPGAAALEEDMAILARFLETGVSAEELAAAVEEIGVILALLA